VVDSRTTNNSTKTNVRILRQHSFFDTLFDNPLALSHHTSSKIPVQIRAGPFFFCCIHQGGLVLELLHPFIRSTLLSEAQDPLMEPSHCLCTYV